MNAIVNDLIYFGIFLMVGLVIREIFKPLQKLFLSASIIGGVVMLILGPQVLKLITIPQSFSGYSGAMIRIIMCCLVFGTNINIEKLINYGDYIMVVHGVYGWQTFLGIALGALLLNFFPGLPVGWGFQAVQSFYGGHGTAGAAGAVFQQVTGSTAYTDLGMVMSTFGLIFAMTVGMVVVNIGVRKGWTTYVKEVQRQPPHFFGGSLPIADQKPVGRTKTTSFSVNHLALQFGFILCSMFIGEQFGKLLVGFIPALKGVSTLAWDTLGGLMGWYFFKFVKLDKFVDRQMVTQISGLCLEILLVGAMATLNLTVLAANIIPILIMSFVICGLTVVYPLWFAKMTCKNEWFEKAIFIIGQSTGATPTGLALVRAVDPDSVACPPEAHGIYSGVFFWTAFFTSLFPPLLAAGNNTVPYVAGIIQFVVTFIIGWLVFRPIMLKSLVVKR